MLQATFKCCKQQVCQRRMPCLSLFILKFMCSELLNRAASCPCLLSLLCQVEDIPQDAVPDNSNKDSKKDSRSSGRSSSGKGSGRKRQSSRSQENSHEATTSSSSSSLISASSSSSSSSAAAAASCGPTCDHCQKHYNDLQPLACASCATTVRICLLSMSTPKHN